MKEERKERTGLRETETAVAPEVKAAVWERGGHGCVLCGSPFAAPDAAYFPRSQGGPGIPENTVTLCFCCRARIDNGSETAGIRERLRRYLKSRYPGWDDQIWKDRKG